MKRDLPSRYADALVSRSKLIIALVLVITAVVGTGAVVGTSEERGIGQAGIDSPAQDTLTKIDATYETNEDGGQHEYPTCRRNGFNIRRVLYRP